MLSAQPRVFWSVDPERDLKKGPWKIEELVESIQSTENAETFAFCIIEGITEAWANFMSKHMNLDNRFFKDHFSQRQGGKVHGWEWTVDPAKRSEAQRHEEADRWR